MSAPQIVGTPAPAAPAPPPAATDTPAAPDAVETPAASDDSGGDGEDEYVKRRREARKILFDPEEPAEPAEPTEDKPKEPKEPKVEAKTEPEKPKEPERTEDEIALSRQWKRFRQDRKELDSKVREFETRTKSIEEREAKLAARESKHADPLAYLMEMGWTKDKVVEWIQSDGKVDPEILVKQFSEKHQRELEELRAERQREKEQLELEKNQRKLEALGAELDAEVATMVGGGEEYPLLKKFAAKKGIKSIQTRVRDAIARVWQQKQEVVAPEAALAYFENELAEIQLGDAPGQLPAVQSAKAAAVEPKPITNQATSQRVVVPSQYDETDPEARRRRAKAILDGEIDE